MVADRCPAPLTIGYAAGAIVGGITAEPRPPCSARARRPAGERGSAGDQRAIDSYLKNRPLKAGYNGYGSCPIVTSSHAMLLAEFDYDLNLTPSIPLLDPTKPHRAYWYLKKYGLPFMYWNLILKGLA